MIKQVVFICGLGGDAGMTYVPALRLFCEQKGWEFFAPSMPSFEEGITYDKYKSSFENLIHSNNIDFKHLLVIGQSAGTNFTVKYFGANKFEIGGYISVSGFSKNVDKEVSKETKMRLSILDTFFPTELEYSNFKNLSCKKLSVFGGNDCFFTVENLKNYANFKGRSTCNRCVA